MKVIVKEVGGVGDPGTGTGTGKGIGKYGNSACSPMFPEQTHIPPLKEGTKFEGRQNSAAMGFPFYN